MGGPKSRLRLARTILRISRERGFFIGVQPKYYKSHYLVSCLIYLSKKISFLLNQTNRQKTQFLTALSLLILIQSLRHLNNQQQNSQAMILQYLISVFGFTFFKQPKFTNFKIRVINQQSNQFKDSIIVDVKKLDSSLLPLQIKMKGSLPVQIKFKVIAINLSNNQQSLTGQGVGIISEQTLDQSIRILIIDKKRGDKQVSICSLDVLVTGQQLIKKSPRNSIQRKDSVGKRDQGSEENIIFSDMSYTVEQQDDIEQNEQKSITNRQKQEIANNNSIKNIKKTQNPQNDDFKLKLQQIHNERGQPQTNRISSYQQSSSRISNQKLRISFRKHHESAVREESKESSQMMDPEISSEFSQSAASNTIHQNIQNTVYLERKTKIINPNIMKTSSQYQPQSYPSSKRRFSPRHFQNKQIKNSPVQSNVSPEKLRQTIEQSQNLMKKLRKYMEQTKSPQKQKQKYIEKVPVKSNHKFRNKEIKVEAMEDYKIENKFVTYNHDFFDKHLKILKNFRVCRVKYQNNKQKTTLVPMDWLRIAFPQLQGFVTFDATGHRQYFKTNSKKEQAVEIRLPISQDSYNLTVNIQGQGDYQGLIGGQQGEQMVINLRPRGTIKHENSRQESYKFYFDIKSQHSPQKIQKISPVNSQKSFIQNPNVSFRVMEDIIAPTNNVKQRVKSLSVQPWGYGRTYIQDIHVNQEQLKKVEVDFDEIKKMNFEEDQNKAHIDTKEYFLQQKQEEDHREKIKVRAKSFAMKKKKKKRKVIQYQTQGAEQQTYIQKIKQKLPTMQQDIKQKSIAHDIQEESLLKKPQVNLLKLHPKYKKKDIKNEVRHKETFDESSLKKGEEVSLNLRGKNSTTVSVIKRKQIKQINQLRNGNRNNYRFRQQNQIKKQQEKAQPNLKQLWEKLLIKKKITQQQRSVPRYTVVNKDESKEETENYKIQKSDYSLTPKNKNQRKKDIYSADRAIKKIDRGTIFQDQQKHKNQNQGSNLYGCISGTNQVLKVEESWQKNAIIQAGHTPSRKITLQIKNISITEPNIVIDDDTDSTIGKFVKLSIKDKVTYFTEIIFNGAFNSILWKLSGCIFRQLYGTQRLEVQLFSTKDNKITLVGNASIRVSKLHFLRKNHIYNGNVQLNGVNNGQFIMGFEVEQFYPFEVIRQEDQQTIASNSRMKSYKNAPFNYRSQPLNHQRANNQSNYIHNKGRSNPKMLPTLKRKVAPQYINRLVANTSLNETMRRSKAAENISRMSAHRFSVQNNGQSGMPSGLRDMRQ